MPHGGADRESARPEEIDLLLDECPCLREHAVDLRGRQVERPVDEVLPELLDRFERTRADARPLPCDLPDRKPEQSADDSDGADHRHHDGRPPRYAVPQHPGEHRPQERRHEDRDEERHDEELQLDDEPDEDAGGHRDHDEPPRVCGRHSQAVRQGLLDLTPHRLGADRVEEGRSRLLVRQNWIRGGSAMAAPPVTSKNSRSWKPRLRANMLFGNTLIFVLSSRTPPL